MKITVYKTDKKVQEVPESNTERREKAGKPDNSGVSGEERFLI